MFIAPDYDAFVGQHCETTAMGNLLKHAGLPLTEPMLFGVGEGLGFGVFQFKGMAAPFIGGRSKGEEVTKALVRNLGLDVAFSTTRSRRKAWANVADFIDQGQPVAVKLDAYFLDYFDIDIHFAGHYVAVHGYDDEFVYLVDTDQQGGMVRSRRDRFEEGRLWKGPMASNALSWTIAAAPAAVDWPTVLRRAITANAQAYLNPPIRNFGARGVRKAAGMAQKWMQTLGDPVAALDQLGGLMERGGTGGGLFRRIYAAFLTEANGHLADGRVALAAQEFGDAADGWTAVSRLFENATAPGLDQAAARMRTIADIEERAMTRLAAL